MISAILRNAAFVSALLAGGAVLARQYIRGEEVPLDPSIKATGKVAIVTGANSGIGKETAKELARRGATVYMACRNAERCAKAREEIVNETKNSNVFCRKCDLEDFHSIGQFTEGFKAEQKRLDILINNAAVILTLAKHVENDSKVTKQGIEQQFGINHVGHFLLTSFLLETLKKSSPSRIIIVTCFSHRDAEIDFHHLDLDEYFTPLSAYDRSKLANILFANHLSEMLTGTGVTVNSVSPGMAATELGRRYHLIDDGPASLRVGKPIFEFIAKSPYQGSFTSIYAALEPSLEKVTGKYFSYCTEDAPSSQAQSKADAKKLWTLTQNLISDAKKKQ